MDLSTTNLRQRYLESELTPTAVVDFIAKATSEDPNRVRIHRWPVEKLREYVKVLEGEDVAALPLYDIAFAVADNIDRASQPTTDARLVFAYTLKASAVSCSGSSMLARLACNQDHRASCWRTSPTHRPVCMHHYRTPRAFHTSIPGRNSA
jgi:hypothetical protein